MESLNTQLESQLLENFQTSESIEWHRSTEIGLDKLIVCDIELRKANDVRQGAAQDCWLVAACCALYLSKHSHWFEAIFGSIESEQDAALQSEYRVRLCPAGQWRIVVVDDLLPCKAKHSSQSSSEEQLIFSSSSHQLWMPLIEKAFAILYGSYAELSTGYAYDAFATLTGMPSNKLVLDCYETSEELWDILIRYFEVNNFPMVASCGNGTLACLDKTHFNRVGLRQKHSYTVVGLCQSTRRVQLYNPWGFFQPDASLQEGIFWFEFNRFTQFFDSVSYCKLSGVPSQIKESRFSHLKNSSKCFEFLRLRVPQVTNLDVMLFPESLDSPDRKKTATDLCLVLLDASNQLVTSSGKRHFDSLVTLETHQLPVGDYSVVLLSFRNFISCDASSVCFNVSLHSTSEVPSEIVRITDTEHHVYSSILRDSILELLKYHGNVHRSSSDVVVRSLTVGWCGLLMSVSNSSPDKSIQFFCDANLSTNVVSTRSALRIDELIPPEHEKIVMILTHYDPTLPMAVRPMNVGISFATDTVSTTPQPPSTVHLSVERNVSGAKEEVGENCIINELHEVVRLISD